MREVRGVGKPEDIFERFFFSFALSWVYIGRSGEGEEGDWERVVASFLIWQ